MKLLPSALAVLIAGTALFAAAADTLGEKVTCHGYDWIIGKWSDKATGGTIKVSYEWRLDKHAIAVKAETPERSSEGLIGMNPKSGDLGYVAVDNQGGGAVGKVEVDAERIILKIAYVDADGSEGRMAIVHERTDDNTIKVSIRELSDSGEVGQDKKSIEMTRQK